jgi:DNA (cytosine-5)-methyltransferase 1
MESGGRMRTYYEFFAGGGMVRAGLGPGWRCLLANDIDAKKAAAYALNFGADALRCADVAALTTADLPGQADLAWASFPCQDLSLAGRGAGLRGKRSGTFWAFHRLMEGLRLEGRAPAIIALENVVGLLTSHGGEDFKALVTAMVSLGYRVGAMVINAERFVPQSRPRVFFVCVRNDIAIPDHLFAAAPPAWCASPALLKAASAIDGHTAHNWVWWALPEPPARNIGFSDIAEDEPEGVRWHTAAETARIIGMMSPLNRAKLHAAKLEAATAPGRRIVGGVYRRTRPDGHGAKTQRAEVRFDDVSGCLRTPAGGSSRQVVMVVDSERVRTRLLAPREAARLMGLPDSYRLPANYNDAYHLLGDGVAAPVAGWLGRMVFEGLSCDGTGVGGRTQFAAAA